MLTAYECAERLLTSAEYHRLLRQQHPKIVEMQRMMATVNVTVNFVCHDYVLSMESSMSTTIIYG